MNFFSTVTWQQFLTVVAVPALISVVTAYIPPGPLQTALIGLIGAMGAQAVSSFRKPSTQGGTTTPAANINVNGSPAPSAKAASDSAKS